MKLNSLFGRVKQLGVKGQDGMNLIAFSGGVDSSLVAAAVHKVFPSNTKCVLGKSASLSLEQLTLARKVAQHIGVELIEVNTKEGTSEQYLKNDGMACYSCKSHLYAALLDVTQLIKSEPFAVNKNIILFNGTNKDDMKDPTRVGLIAAKEFKVASPLEIYTKSEVRSLAKEMNLFNHNYAASPCLRSRLALGITATTENLLRIEKAENIVKTIINPTVDQNIRVRQLGPDKARVEMDNNLLEIYADLLPILTERLTDLGFKTVSISPFKSGSVSIKLN